MVLLRWVFSFFLLSSFIMCRKLRIKRSFKVPAISNKLADIPPDDFSWRKYGQKPIKGSPHPRYFDVLPTFSSCCQDPFRLAIHYFMVVSFHSPISKFIICGTLFCLLHLGSSIHIFLFLDLTWCSCIFGSLDTIIYSPDV